MTAGKYKSTSKMRINKKQHSVEPSGGHQMTATIHTTADNANLPVVKGAMRGKRKVAH